MQILDVAWKWMSWSKFIFLSNMNWINYCAPINPHVFYPRVAKPNNVQSCPPVHTHRHTNQLLALYVYSKNVHNFGISTILVETCWGRVLIQNRDSTYVFWRFHNAHQPNWPTTRRAHQFNCEECANLLRLLIDLVETLCGLQIKWLKIWMLYKVLNILNG